MPLGNKGEGATKVLSCDILSVVLLSNLKTVFVVLFVFNISHWKKINYLKKHSWIRNGKVAFQIDSVLTS